MKKIIISLGLLVIFSLLLNSCKEFKKNKSNNSIIKEYQNQYYDSTLANNILPVLMPYNKIINPIGKQIYFGDPGRENHALDCALSPDNKTLAVEGRYSIVFINTSTNKIKYRLRLRDNKNYKYSLNTYSGIKWYKKSNKLYVFWSTASLKKSISNVIMALWDGSKAHIVGDFPFIAEKPAKTALPNELEITKENGEDFLYVVLNGNNKIVKINIKTKKTIWQKNTGMVPYGIVAANGNIYITNWAGFKPAKNDTNVAGAPWGSVKVETKTGATSSGSVSVINTKNGELIAEIKVGLHPNDIIKSPDEKFVYVANANSDDVSVINTKTNKLCETISVRLLKEKNPFYGDSPDGLGITNDGSTLFVANGMDNALAVVKLGKNSFSNSEIKNSKIIGFIPTEAYPGAVAVLNDSILYIANIEAEGARETISTGENDAFKTFHKELQLSTNKCFNSHRMLASVSVIPLPDAKDLKDETTKVVKLNNLFRLKLVKLLPRKNILPVPVPERIGEPSVFKHVIYIIKENRTYDQVLGDMKEGRGEPLLCAFGKKITPNTHRLSKDFLLMDNYYASGKCSAEGHQWTDASIVTDYIEKNVRAWFRSYPHVQTDAMVYHKTGFIWDNALDHNKSVRIYGEAAIPKWSSGKKWKDIYNDYLHHKKFDFKNITTVARVKEILSPDYPGYDSHNIPDVLRAEAFIKELKEYEKKQGDQLPELMIIALPNDHTAGTRPDHPTPRAMVADNDLALGRIINAVSKSKFWKNTVVFVTEDDSQDGWDHISAYRTVGLVISPYSRLHKTIHRNYNQTSMLRTIEQILGIPPMNIEDATALPMFECFNNIKDLTPYKSIENKIPLNEMNTKLTKLKGNALYFAKLSLETQFDHIDSGDDDIFNRIIWYSTMGCKPYPETHYGNED